MADANGQKFWMLSEQSDWDQKDWDRESWLQSNSLASPSVAGSLTSALATRVAYDPTHRRLRLASQRLTPLWPNRLTLTLQSPEGDRLPTATPFTFTAPSQLNGTSLAITATTPTVPRASTSPTQLSFDIVGAGLAEVPIIEDASADEIPAEDAPVENTTETATVTIGLPNGRFTTRSARQVTQTTFRFDAIFAQPGPWSIRLTLPDGRQSPPFHFTVLAAEADTPSDAIEISGFSPLSTDLGPQTMTLTGQGFQPGMRPQLSFPGGTTNLPALTADATTDSSIELVLNLPALLTTAALRQLRQVPQVIDPYGTWARWDAEGDRITATGAFPPASEVTSEVTIYRLPADFQPTDMALGYDGILYITLNNPTTRVSQIVMVDRRDRWRPHTVPLPENFRPWRLAPHPDGGMWALDHLPQPISDPQPRQIVRIQGEPIPTIAQQAFTPDTFRPCEENPNPPRAHIVWQGQFPDETIVAITSHTSHQLALLTWVPGNLARLRTWKNQPTPPQSMPPAFWSTPLTLTGAERPFSLKWLSATTVTCLVPGLTTEAVTYDLPSTHQSQSSSSQPQRLTPNGKTYPLRHYTTGPFLHSTTHPPHYPTSNSPESQSPQCPSPPPPACYQNLHLHRHYLSRLH